MPDQKEAEAWVFWSWAVFVLDSAGALPFWRCPCKPWPVPMPEKTKQFFQPATGRFSGGGSFSCGGVLAVKHAGARIVLLLRTSASSMSPCPEWVFGRQPRELSWTDLGR